MKRASKTKIILISPSQSHGWVVWPRCASQTEGSGHRGRGFVAWVGRPYICSAVLQRSPAGCWMPRNFSLSWTTNILATTWQSCSGTPTSTSMLLRPKSGIAAAGSPARVQVPRAIAWDIPASEHEGVGRPSGRPSFWRNTTTFCFTDSTTVPVGCCCPSVPPRLALVICATWAQKWYVLSRFPASWRCTIFWTISAVVFFNNPRSCFTSESCCWQVQ